MWDHKGPDSPMVNTTEIFKNLSIHRAIMACDGVIQIPNTDMFGNVCLSYRMKIFGTIWAQIAIWSPGPIFENLQITLSHNGLWRSNTDPEHITVRECIFITQTKTLGTIWATIAIWSPGPIFENLQITQSHHGLWRSNTDPEHITVRECILITQNED